jgi:hypothetical protein
MGNGWAQLNFGCCLRRKQMKNLLISFVFLLGVGSLFIGRGLLAQDNEAVLKDVDAMQAMAIANEWKWTQKRIKSYVTTREVVFEFSDGKSKKIPLPEEKMLVAVAPYINRTHK